MKNCIRIQGHQMYMGEIVNTLVDEDVFPDIDRCEKLDWYQGWYGIKWNYRDSMWYYTVDFVQADDGLYTMGGDIWTVSGKQISCSYYGTYTKVK